MFKVLQNISRRLKRSKPAMPGVADITPEKAQEIIVRALLEEVADLKERVEKLEAK